MPRDQATADPVKPLMGIIAGCTNAMALVKAYMIREIDGLVKRHPLVVWDMYIFTREKMNVVLMAIEDGGDGCLLLLLSLFWW